MADGDQRAETLSKRELEVASAYASGESYKEIARTLGLSPTTVRTHLRTVYTKLGVTSKIELARFLEGDATPDQSLDQSEVAADLALELDDAVRRERSLAKVLKIVSDHDGNLDTVIDAVLAHALEICEAEFGILFEYQGDMKFRELRSRNISAEFAGWLAEHQTFEVEPGTGIGRVASDHQTVNIADVRGEDIYQSAAPLRIATADLGKARSFAAIPMMSGGRLIGAFTVYRTRVHPFNDRALELASAFADQAVIAIENVRRFQELQHRLERAAATREVLDAIRDSRDDAAPALDVILRRAAQLCDADAAAMTLGREGDERQSLAAAQDMHPKTRALYRNGKVSMNPETSLVARAIVTGKTLHVPDYADTDDYRAGEEVFRSLVDDTGLRTSVNVPLISDGAGIGALVLYRKEVRPYTDDQIALVETFAAQAVIAIENAAQFRDLQARLEREAVNREILHLISQNRDDDRPVFDFILQSACRLCNAQSGYVTVVDEAGTHIGSPVQFGTSEAFAAVAKTFYEPIATSTLTAPQAIRERRALRITDIADSDLYREGHRVRTNMVDIEGIRSILTVPLLTGESSLGAIVMHRHEVNPFRDEDVALVESFAAQAVIAIENVRQFREVQARLDREAVNKEILRVISESPDDEQPVFDFILENARRLCEADVGAFVMGKEGGGPQVMVANTGATEETLALYRDGEFTMEPGGSNAADAIIQRKVIQVEDYCAEPRYVAGDPRFRHLTDVQGIRTNLLVPLISHGEGIGCLILWRHNVRPYTSDQIALVETFATQAVIAIENVRQFNALQTQLKSAQSNREILEIIRTSRDDEKPVFEAIARNAVDLCDAQFCMLWRYDGTDIDYCASHGFTPEFMAEYLVDYPMPPGSDGIVYQVIQAGRTVHLPNAQADPYKDAAVARQHGYDYMLGIPVETDDGIWGIMVLAWPVGQKPEDQQVEILETFAAQAVIAIENVRQFRALEALNAELGDRVEEQVGEIERMGRLKRFLSPAVADAVVTKGEGMLSSHRALIATLFCDIRGFTAFCETAEPEETIEVLQTYHEEMGALISAHGGGVDKRMGDGIMVIFNDPFPCEDPAGDAVRLAIAMRKRMENLCKAWKRHGHRLGFGVGISLGYATIGMVGSEGRYDYTASGTSVNLAARLCERAEDGEILLSPRACTAVEEDFQAKSSGEMHLKGLREPIEVFCLQA